MTVSGTHAFLLIGHRGYAGRYPENTLAGFRAAAQAGLKMVELDVRLSRDRHLVVIHDADLVRLAGIHRRVNQLTLNELKSVDAGAWFDHAFSGERIPTLAEVFAVLPSEMGINVEIKPSVHELEDPPDGVERQVLTVIDRFARHRSPIVSSFNPAVLRRIRDLSPRQSLAVLSDAHRQPDGVAFCETVTATAWHPHQNLVTAQRVTEAHNQGLKVYPFTVKSAADLQRLKAADVDGVISDDPLGLMSQRSS
ncbi:MAG: glycerophosphodiester phosphodiesterase family protein [Desulfosarcinaceae bacterium]